MLQNLPSTTRTSDSSTKPLTLCLYDYEFLTGTWPHVKGGAAWNVVSTFCRNAGFGGFNDPTVKGYEAMKAWEK